MQERVRARLAIPAASVTTRRRRGRVAVTQVLRVYTHARARTSSHRNHCWHVRSSSLTYVLPLSQSVRGPCSYGSSLASPSPPSISLPAGEEGAGNRAAREEEQQRGEEGEYGWNQLGWMEG